MRLTWWILFDRSFSVRNPRCFDISKRFFRFSLCAFFFSFLLVKKDSSSCTVVKVFLTAHYRTSLPSRLRHHNYYHTATSVQPLNMPPPVPSFVPQTRFDAVGHVSQFQISHHTPTTLPHLPWIISIFTSQNLNNTNRVLPLTLSYRIDQFTGQTHNLPVLPRTPIYFFFFTNILS